MGKPLDELYFTWLYSQVSSVRVRNPQRTYWSMFKQLYTKEFLWFIPNDDNRVEDGMDLREEFLNSRRMNDVDPDWMGLKCSMLELIITLARWMSFETYNSMEHWFWELVSNMNIDQYNDAEYGKYESQVIDEACDRVIWREYDYDGQGGLFPLHNPLNDQTKVELWYQLNAYLIELD